MKFFLLLFVVFAPSTFAQTYSGSLEETDPIRENGVYYDEHSFQAAENQMVTVRMTGEGFDTYLYVYPPSDQEPYANDDYEGVSISQVEFIARETGMYRIHAAGYSAGLTGDYEIQITLGDIADVETIEGRLVPGDEQALKGEFFDEHTVQGLRNGQITFELISYGFDGFLVVRSPSSEMYRNDDAMDMSHNGPMTSRIGPLDQAQGQWTVYVTSLSANEMGAYDLRMIRTD